MVSYLSDYKTHCCSLYWPVAFYRMLVVGSAVIGSLDILCRKWVIIWFEIVMFPPTSIAETRQNKHLSTLKKLSLLDSLVPFDLAMTIKTFLTCTCVTYMYKNKICIYFNSLTILLWELLRSSTIEISFSSLLILINSSKKTIMH